MILNSEPRPSTRERRGQCNTILVICFVVIASQPFVLLICWRSCLLLEGLQPR